MAETPVSLYLELEKGKIADLEVVARSALAFAKALRDVAYIVDPSMEVRIELASGTPGSLSLNSFLRNLKNKNGETLTLSAIALIALGWFGNVAWDISKDEVADFVREHLFHQHGEHFSPDQQRELTAIVKKALEEKAAAPHVRQVYRELERDPVIKGVGATTTHGAKPTRIVPRAQFAERAGERVVPVVPGSRRVIAERVHVGLVSPVLIPGDRRWRLRSATGEFGATIKDKDFVDKVIDGQLSIPLAGGIEMDVRLEVTEDFKDGVWKVHERAVTHVYLDTLKRPEVTMPLPFPEPNHDQTSDRDD